VSGIFASVLVGACPDPAGAQMAEVKEKPRMYTYEAFWSIPRARWAEMDKPNPPLASPAFGSMVDWTKHRDYLVHTTATYK
jgi:hypothetical protein